MRGDFGSIQPDLVLLDGRVKPGHDTEKIV